MANINVSKEACEARKAFKQTCQWCREVLLTGTITEYQLAEVLRQEAYEHMKTVLGAENP